MFRYFPRFAILLALAVPFAGPALNAQAVPPARPDAAVEKLMAAPEHQGIPWKVNFFSPRLMYQQVYLVQIRARVDPNALKRIDAGRMLHFIARVESEDGKWLHGGEYKDYPVPADIGSRSEIEYATAVYFRPGNYTLVLAVFETDSGKSSVARETVRIPKLNDDPLPELDQYLAPVEFPKGFPDQEVGRDHPDDGELFPLALLDKPVPVANSRPVLLDIVLDITKRPKPQIPQYFDNYGRPIRIRRPIEPSMPAYDMEAGRILQTGDLLARLQPRSGCVRVSAVDVLRMKTILDRGDAKTLDWVSFEKQIESLDQDTVDVSVLTNKKGPAQFMRGYLDQLSADSSACGAGAIHYIVIVSHEVPFPAKDRKLPEVERERARFYYVYSQIGSSMGDDLADLLKPVKPERLSFNTPRDLRKAFAKIVSDLESGK